jgi:hypothetical protein
MTSLLMFGLIVRLGRIGDDTVAALLWVVEAAQRGQQYFPQLDHQFPHGLNGRGCFNTIAINPIAWKNASLVVSPGRQEVAPIW